MRLLLSLCLLALPPLAWAQTTSLTEAEAVRLGLMRVEVGDLEHGALLAAEADALAAGLYPNPTLSYSRERIGGSPETIEQVWMLEQNFDVSGRRGLRREAASRRVAAAAASNAARRIDMTAEIRRSFYDTLFRQELIRATATWMQHFAHIEGMVGKLARSGEVSGYDRRRLESERRTAAARLATERADHGRALARLAAFTNLRGEPMLAGPLLPPPLPPLDTALAKLGERPDLQALSRRAEAADLDGRAAERGAIPELTVGIGPKRADDGFVRNNGVALSLSVPLPVFDRQQPGRQRAAAEALQARADYQLAKSRAEAELQGLHRQTENLRAVAAAYRASAVAATADLLRIAEKAYQGGESSLLALLDAYRAALETETMALELEQRARLARIEYDFTIGSPE
jgi:cobalt-zinc-cadmium efflux system outer membrane protein